MQGLGSIRHVHMHIINVNLQWFFVIRLARLRLLTTTHCHLPEYSVYMQLLYTPHKPEHKAFRCRPAITRQYTHV